MSGPAAPSCPTLVHQDPVLYLDHVVEPLFFPLLLVVFLLLLPLLRSIPEAFPSYP